MIHMVSQWERTECNSSLIMIHSYTNIVLGRVSDHMGCNVHICMLSLRTNEGIYRGKKIQQAFSFSLPLSCVHLEVSIYSNSHCPRLLC